MSKKISITIPHSYCVDKTVHTCDYIALTAASYLFKYFKKLNTEVFIYTANKNRTEIDYNRAVSRYSIWRKRIESEMTSNNIQLALDIHSYPPSKFSFGYFDEQNKILPEIVILDSYHKDDKFLDDITSTNFLNYLLSFNIKALLLKGGENDIMISIREQHKRCILIEFNEDLSSDRLDYIASNIVNYFIQLL